MAPWPRSPQRIFKARSMKSGKPMRRVRLCALTSLLILANCGSLRGTPATDGHAAFCDVAKPITYSRQHDTAETLEQIKEFLRVGHELCGWPLDD